MHTDEVTMEEVGQAAQLRAGELIIIVVVLVMWAGKNMSSLLVRIILLLQLWLHSHKCISTFQSHLD